METVRCDFCHSEASERLYTGSEWEKIAPAQMVLRRCQQCGLIYLNPRPNPAELGNYYPENYTPFRPAIEDEPSRMMQWMRRRKLAQRRQLVESYSQRTSGSILDVGCATGLFLHEMALAGWQTAGVEPTISAADYARQRFGLEVFTGLLEQAPYTPASFDVVTFWDVLEHTFSPTATLKQTAELLRPGGLVAINIPNWHSFDRHIFGVYWIGLDPPRHLYVFTPSTLTTLLRQAGFEPLAWRCFMPAYFPFVISLERWLNARSTQTAQLTSRALNFPGVRLLFEPWFAGLNWLNRGAVISVFACKQ